MMKSAYRRFGHLSSYSSLYACSSPWFGLQRAGRGDVRRPTLDGYRLRSSSLSPASLGGMTFSEEQWDAVTAPLDVPSVRVIAGPGSGKTRVLAGRIHYMLHMNPSDASRIVAMTFTNKASEEMKQRVGMEGVVFGTFHSFCYRQLKVHAAHVMDAVFSGRDGDWMVMDDDDCRQLMEKVVKEYDMDASDGGVLARSLLSKIKRLKNSVGYLDPKVGYETYSGDESLLFWITAYEKALRDAGALDFEDLLGVFEHVVKTNKEVATELRNRFKYILVDEFQDANVVQYNIVKHLCRGDAKQVYVVGDVDQTIYTWRGASADHMRDLFVKDFPTSVCYTLKDNYRSTRDILGVAQSLISTLNNSDRVDEFHPVRKDGHGVPVDVFVYSNAVEEGVGIAQDIKSRLDECDDCRIAVLLRTHALGKFIETALASAQVPYTVVGGVSFWKRSEIRDIMAYLKLALHMSDVLSLERVINTPKRGIGPAAMKVLGGAAEAQGTNTAEYVFGAMHEDDIPVSKSARKSLNEFLDLVRSIRMKLEQNEPLHDVLGYIVDSTGYREYVLGVKEEDSKKHVRFSNIEQLIDMSRNISVENVADGDSVQMARAFVGDAAVYAEDDAPGNAPVQIMTMHAAKGLEFNRVYVPFFVEGLIPCVVQQESSMDPWEQMDEETRLMFVSITRAKDSLCVSYNKDVRHGRSNKPSRFFSLMFAKERPNLVDFTVD